MNGAAAPAVLLVLGLGSVLGALRCLSERLLVSAAIYCVLGAGLVAAAGKAALDTI
ncbi:MAG: hypothetical protein ACJ77Z_04070 [Thermoleophilaceae bacterium]